MEGAKQKMRIRWFPLVTAAASFLIGQPAAAQVTAEQGYPSQITLKWDEMPNASGYRICRREINGDWCILADLEDETQYTDLTVEEGTRYMYSVRAFAIKNGRQVQWFDDEILENICVLPPEPENIQVAPGENGGSLELSWDIGTDSTGNRLLYAVSYYEIYHKKADDLTWQFLTSTESLPNRKDTAILLADIEETDWYTVRAAYRNANGDTVYSAYDEIGTEGGIPPAATSRIYYAASKGTKGNIVSWISLSSKATKLEILRKEKKDGTFQRIKTITNPDQIKNGVYTDTDIVITGEYWYTVRAYYEESDNQTSGWYETEGIAIQALPNSPSQLTASCLASDTLCIQVAWNANENTEDSCDGYRIYRRNPDTSEWKLLGTNTGTGNVLFLDTTVEAGNAYEYQVKAYKLDRSKDIVESDTADYVRAEVPKQ